MAAAKRRSVPPPPTALNPIAAAVPETDRPRVHGQLPITCPRLRRKPMAALLHLTYPISCSPEMPTGAPSRRCCRNLAERARRRFQRQLREARLPAGKTLDSFDFTVVPLLSKAHVTASDPPAAAQGSQGSAGQRPVT